MCSVVLDLVRVKIGLVNGKKLDKRGIKKATLQFLFLLVFIILELNVVQGLYFFIFSYFLFFIHRVLVW